MKINNHFYTSNLERGIQRDKNKSKHIESDKKYTRKHKKGTQAAVKYRNTAMVALVFLIIYLAGTRPNALGKLWAFVVLR